MEDKKRLIDANEFFDTVRFTDADMYEVDADENHTYGFTREAIKDMLDNAPTVDAVEVVHGRWEHTLEGIYYQVRCTACGQIAIKANYDLFGSFTVTWPYCPNCGAKMDGDVYV